MNLSEQREVKIVEVRSRHASAQLPPSHFVQNHAPAIPARALVAKCSTVSAFAEMAILAILNQVLAFCLEFTLLGSVSSHLV